MDSICFGYPRRPFVLNNIDFKLSKGERIGLVGPNGSGKTTLFYLIMGLLKPVSGTVEIYGKIRKRDVDFREVRERIGLLFQNPDDQLFCPSVAEDVSFGPLNLGKTHAEAKRIVGETLSCVGLEGFENRITHKLSEGEKRLVSFASILSMNPNVLLLDEPTAGLDEATSARIMNILKNSRFSYVIISHDEDLIGETTEDTYKLQNGKLYRIAI